MRIVSIFAVMILIAGTALAAPGNVE